MNRALQERNFLCFSCRINWQRAHRLMGIRWKSPFSSLLGKWLTASFGLWGRVGRNKGRPCSHNRERIEWIRTVCHLYRRSSHIRFHHCHIYWDNELRLDWLLSLIFPFRAGENPLRGWLEEYFHFRWLCVLLVLWNPTQVHLGLRSTRMISHCSQNRSLLFVGQCGNHRIWIPFEWHWIYALLFPEWGPYLFKKQYQNWN